MKIYIFTLIILLFFTTSNYGQEPYFVPNNSSIPLSATSINSMDVESMDVDGDDDLDLIIAAEYSRNLLFFNDGNGVFTEDASRLFPEKNTGDAFTGEDSEDIAFADFNQDGFMDILFVSEDTFYHELLLNDGTGLFSFISYEFPPSSGNAIAILDLNNDNFPDIIIGNTGQNHVYINNQDNTFTQDNSRWPINTEGTQDLKLVDLDGDTDLDIVEGIDLGTNNILINTDGVFTEENNRLPTTGLTLETRKISLADVNGDTHLDIFVSTVNFIGTAHLQNRLYLNDGNGFFSDSTDSHLPTYFQNTLDAVFIDYDYDNDLDLITTDFQNPSISYHSFENDGAGIFTETTNEVFQPFSFTNGVGLHSADFNGDTFPDLYFSNFQETDDILFFSEEALSTNELDLTNTSMVYPNPSNSEINIQCKGLKTNISEVTIKIFNALGNEISFDTKQIIFNESYVTINVSHLRSGVYLYDISNSTSDICNGKFIKK